MNAGLLSFTIRAYLELYQFATPMHQTFAEFAIASLHSHRFLWMGNLNQVEGPKEERAMLGLEGYWSEWSCWTTLELWRDWRLDRW